MDFSKTLALVAVGGMLAACGGGAAATDGAADPATAAPAGGEKQGCKGEGHSCAPGKCGANKPAEGAAPADGAAAAPAADPK